MKRNRKPTTAKGRNAVEARSQDEKRARLPGYVALLWAAAVLLSLVLAGCPKFNVFYVGYAISSLVLIGGELAFLSAIYRRGRSELFPAFKKFMGYGLVAHYVASALPRVNWSNLGLIGEGRVVFLFVLASICLAIGLVFFIIASRPASFASLGLITQQELEDPALRRKHRNERKKGALGIVLEWVDALAFAAVAVILVNIFIFQLYVVPSESMVPVFLSGDRPFTSKFLAGPRIPLTDWRLPFARLPRRGDVVTIANPRYPENHRVDLKKYLSQLVAMVSFTAVNIDKLPDGTPKADPLVKRIVGLPGEKLMMVDDILYVERKGDTAFAPLAADRNYARIDLWKEPDAVRARIASIRVDENVRKLLSDLDARKRETDPAALATSIAGMAQRILGKLGQGSPAIVAFEQHELPRLNQLVVSARDKLAAEAASGAEARNVFSRTGLGQPDEDLPLALALARSAQLRSQLAAFSLPPPGLAAGADPYTIGTRKLDLLIKENLLGRIERDIELILSGARIEDFLADKSRASLKEEAGNLSIYLSLYDFRNFPVFPSGKDFLGPTEYFAMGDNRYNSLDFRFKSEIPEERSLDASDPNSVAYISNMEPFALDRRFIEGYAMFRIWPPSRIGAIR